MAATIECPRCSEPVLVMPRRLDADQYSGQCKACGLHFVVHKSVLFRPPPEVAPVVDEAEAEELRRRRQVRNLILVFTGIPIACVVLGVLILVAGWFGDSRRQWRDEQQRTKLIAMKAEADALAARGRLSEADFRYKRIAGEAQALRESDPKADALIDEVEISQRQLAQRRADDLAARQAPSPPPVAVAPTPRPAPVTQPASQPAETRPARPPRGAVIAAAENGGDLTDEQIERALARGAAWLRTRFKPDTHVLGDDLPFDTTDVSHFAGLDALCVYASIEAGLALRDSHSSETSQRMDNLIEALKKLPIEGNAVTYARGLRATALAVFNRPQDRETLRADAAYLLATHNHGAYTYAGEPIAKGRDGPPPAGRWDNSNSQYGLLGVWSAAEAGVPVPAEYWSDVESHWTRCQSTNGQWDYSSSGGGGTVSMTAAGTASLFVAHDYLGASRAALQVGREPFPASLRSAMRWWETANDAMDLGGRWWAYTAYGIERVGLASGFRYLGKHDWYREIGKEIIRRQRDDGSFGDEIDTAYSLLFLSRGRSPVLINKLRFDGAWSNRPRDLANLTRYAGRRLEREVGWQVVNLRSNWQDWLNAPVMYFASHQAPELTDFEIAKLRSYVEAGGLLFTQADGDSPKFDAYATQLAATLFPQYPLEDLPPDHFLYKLAAPVKSPIPLKAVRNGSRLLMVHSPKDLGKHWHGREEIAHKDAFALGLNLLVYASGKGGLRNRLESPFIERTAQEPTTVLSVARLQYDGDWNPEPAAWSRFTSWLRRRTSADINEVVVGPADLTFDTAPMAHLTGSRSFVPTETDAAAIKRYVEAGGTLLIDAAGGQKGFADAAERLLSLAFPDKKLEPLPNTHPMLNRVAAGMDDLSSPRVRPFVIETSRNAPLQILSAGRGRVVFSRLDITTGLLGTRTWGVAGYDPDYAVMLVKNILFWTVDEQLRL